LDVCGDGTCNGAESYTTCPADCLPHCLDGTTPTIPAGHATYYCQKTAYTWTKQLDNTCSIHFHSDGTITYTNETNHGALSTNPAYAYPFGYDETTMFPNTTGTFYNLNVTGSSCLLIGAGTISANEIIVPINEPSGGEHVCTAVIQKNTPAN
jgi:hypothetical protein